jgi:hypothetical protein
MNKIKIDERLENAVNAFFEAGPDTSRFELTYSGQSAALASDAPAVTEKVDKWLRILRELFMLGPGTFALFFYTLTMVFHYPGVAPRPYWYALAVFLTYAGSGSLRNVKNLAVPGVVILLAVAVALLSTYFLGKEVAGFYFWDSIYLLPAVLIAAKLVQAWAADK